MDYLMERLSEYTVGDIEANVLIEVARWKHYCESHEIPNAVLLAGQPGAGKTMLSNLFSDRMNGDVVHINGDEFRRLHPNYRLLRKDKSLDLVAMTSKFSGAFTEALIDMLPALRYNAIIEGTGRTSEVPIKTAHILKGSGYQVEMVVMAVRPEISLLSTLQRFYEMASQGTVPRATAIAAHDTVVSALPHNLDVILADGAFSRLTIIDREGHTVYDSSETAEKPSKALTKYWERPWSRAEKEFALDKVLDLFQKEDKLKLGQEPQIAELYTRIKNVELVKSAQTHER